MVVGGDGNLGPVARFANDVHNLDHLIRDLRHFQGEEGFDEQRAGAREGDLDPAGVLLDVLDEDLNALADAKLLPGRLVAAGEDSLNFSEVDDQVGPLGSLDDACDEQTQLFFVLVVDLVALGFADLLEQDLFPGHRSDATEIGHSHLVLAVEDLCFPGDPIDGDPEGLKLPQLLTYGGEQSGFYALEDDLFLYVLVPVEGIHEA